MGLCGIGHNTVFPASVFLAFFYAAAAQMFLVSSDGGLLPNFIKSFDDDAADGADDGDDPYLSIYLSIDRSIYLSIDLFIIPIYLSILM